MDRHGDATYETGQAMADGYTNNGLRRPKRCIVSKDGYDSRDVVHDRWLPLLDKGTIVAPGKDYKTANWQYYIVSSKQETVSEQIYCADLPLQEHDPISNGKSIGWNGLRDGIEPWGPKLEMRLPNLAKAGFKLKRFSKKRYYYEVYCRLILMYHGADVSFKWEMAHPDTPPIDGKRATCPG